MNRRRFPRSRGLFVAPSTDGVGKSAGDDSRAKLRMHFAWSAPDTQLQGIGVSTSGHQRFAVKPIRHVPLRSTRDEGNHWTWIFCRSAGCRYFSTRRVRCGRQQALIRAWILWLHAGLTFLPRADFSNREFTDVTSTKPALRNAYIGASTAQAQ